MKAGGGAVLFCVALVSQPTVNVSTSAQQDFLERRAKVAVETGVNDRVEKTVSEAQPQKEAGEPVGDRFAARIAAAEFLQERPD